MEEEWRDIPGHPNYQASSHGQIRNKKRGNILSQKYFQSRHGKEYRSLKLGGRSSNKLVHRLVCMAFHGLPPNESDHAAHKDDDGYNNHKDNLHWRTHLQNQHEKRCRACGDAYSDHDESGVCRVEGCMCGGWTIRAVGKKQNATV